MRIIASDQGLREMDSADGRRRYRRDAGGGFEVAPQDVKAALAWGCFVPSMMSGLRDPNGYRCPCGFAPYFSPCSRCGRPFGGEGDDAVRADG